MSLDAALAAEPPKPAQQLVSGHVSTDMAILSDPQAPDRRLKQKNRMLRGLRSPP
jgi:hypothetical protein